VAPERMVGGIQSVWVRSLCNMLLYFAILARGLSVLSCQLLNIHCQDEHDNEPRNWLWAILQEQSDAKSHLFHFKNVCETKINDCRVKQTIELYAQWLLLTISTDIKN
jgi:hypothetical protein